MTANDVIEKLGLEPHPMEGGYFRQTYRLASSGDSAPLATAIYFLITPTSYSQMHKLPGDELFHFYAGDPVWQLHLDPGGGGRVVTLGTDVLAGQQPQVLVRGGVWQGARLVDGGKWALLGTTMTPGFVPEHFELGLRSRLISHWPDFANQITQLTQD